MMIKHLKLVFRAGLPIPAGGAALLCGLLPIHAGNTNTKYTDPTQEIVAIQYEAKGTSWQLRTDFDGNRDFAELLLQAYERMAQFKSDLPKTDNWRPVAEAYYLAFKELKECLQGEWRCVFGDGASRFPWNGHSDGCTDLWREDDLRRDMPVVLSLWEKGHICSTSVPWTFFYTNSLGGISVPNDNKGYVPSTGLMSDQGAIDKGKDIYKSRVLRFFNAKKLSTCAEYLQKFFCEPVARLLREVAPTLGKSTDKADLMRLLRLYACYYQLDAVRNHSQKDFVETTRQVVRLMRECYLNYNRWKGEDQKWLCSLIENLESNYYVTENLHTYCIQSHDLAYGFMYIRYHNRWAKEKIHDDGLMQMWSGGNNPVPKVTWVKFWHYAGKRLVLFREMIESISGYCKGCPVLTLHGSKTFEQVPCLFLEEEAEKELVSMLKKLDKTDVLDTLERETDKLSEEIVGLDERLDRLNAKRAALDLEREKVRACLRSLRKKREDLEALVKNRGISEQEFERRKEEILKEGGVLKERWKTLDAECVSVDLEKKILAEEFESLDRRSEDVFSFGQMSKNSKEK